LQSEFARQIWSPTAAELFVNLEKDMTNLSLQVKTAVPLGMGIASLAGSAALGGVFLAGLITTTILTSGVALFAVLGVAGGIWHIVSQFNVPQTAKGALLLLA
jgi:homoserine kinase